MAKRSPILHGDVCELREALIFHRAKKATFVAATWSCGSTFDGYLTIDRVRDGRQLELAYSLQGGKLTIVEPSGLDILPDHASLLFVDEASGGSGYEGYRQHILRLTKDIEDITPPLRTVWSEILGGELVVVSSDDRWANFFRGCGQCGPQVPVVSIWTDGHFSPACRSHPDLIETRLRNYLQETAGAEAKGAIVLDVAELKLNIALLQLQLGRGQEGRTAFESALSWLVQKSTEGSIDTESSGQDCPRRIESAMGAAVAAASWSSESQCPLTATRGDGDHPGYQERVDRFRPQNGR